MLYAGDESMQARWDEPCRSGGGSSLTAPVRSAIRHMAQHYAETITLKDLSGLTKLSPYQIIRAFRRELGITPHAWLIRYRVQQGTALLERGESIATVAHEVGFVDQTHFTRHFKRLHGETPARFLTAAQVADRAGAFAFTRGSIRPCL